MPRPTSLCRMLIPGLVPPSVPNFALHSTVEHQEPKSLPPTYTPYPLPKYDEEFGYGPTFIPTDTLPDIPLSISPSTHVSSLEESDKKLLESLDANETSENQSNIQYVDESSHFYSAGYTGLGHALNAPDARNPLIERIDPELTSQISRYRSARSPSELLYEWKKCSSFNFQNIQCVYIREDILSILPKFSNQDLAAVLIELAKNHEIGAPFLSQKVISRPISVHSHIRLPDPLQHQSHFNFLSKIEEHLTTSPGNQRIITDPKFLATVLRCFSHVRCDDATTNYERLVTRQKDAVRDTARAFLRIGDAITEWHPGCGKVLFTLGQELALQNIDEWPLENIVTILGAALSLRQWANGTFVQATGNMAIRLLSSTLTEFNATFHLSTEIFLYMTLGGFWRDDIIAAIRSCVLRITREKGVSMSSNTFLSSRIPQSVLNDTRPLPWSANQVRSRLEHTRFAPQLFLALGSMYPIDTDMVENLWNIMGDENRVIEDYLHLFDLLMRVSDTAQRETLIARTVGDVHTLDRILMQCLPHFEALDMRAVQGFTSSPTIDFLRRTANAVRFLDTSCFWPICTRDFITAEMDLQQTGAYRPVVPYSVLRAIQTRSKHLCTLPQDLRWTLVLVREEIEKGTITPLLPSDELNLCTHSYGTDAMMPIYAVRFMVETIPLVQPVIVSLNPSHIVPDEFPLFNENPVSRAGGYNEIAMTNFAKNPVQKRIIKVVRPNSKTYDRNMQHYGNFVDEKVQGILRNERCQYSRTRNLDSREIVTDRPDYYSYLLDLRRAGHAPVDDAV